MEPAVTQSSAIYFKRYLGSKRRAALFRQLRSSPTDQTSALKQQIFGSTHVTQELRSGQRLLRGLPPGMRAAVGRANVVKNNVSRGVMSKRRGSRSSDHE